jgi:long-chain acyl-CoA synthetase
MNYEGLKSLPELFFSQAEKFAEENFLWAKGDDGWTPVTWRQAETRARELAAGLLDLGIEAGDRVVILSENRPEWLIADIAIMTAGAITVPAYTTNTTHDHEHILNDSGAVAVIVSNRKLAERLMPAAAQASRCRFVLAMEDLEIRQSGDFEYYSWPDVAARGKGRGADLEQRLAALKRSDVACFIYTSGTGGAPKGVMLSHGAMLCNCRGAHDLLTALGLGREVFLSFLPLSHAYEHTAGQFFPISLGAEIYYATSTDQLAANLVEVRPTVMTAVPRLYETLHSRIRRGVAKQSPLKQKLFARTLELGRKRHENPQALSLADKVANVLLDRLVRRNVKARFGGRLKAMVSGGAALNPEIGLFFTALGLRVLQGYGQTEAAPVISCNPPHRIKLESVGLPLTGVEVRIADDGEILVRGELLMNGYWQKPEATEEALKDGWLHTGDIGEFDADGYLRITDRKKDIIVLSGGDNISPARIESLLTLQPEIQQAMVYGDKRPHLIALLVPDEAFLVDFARANGVKPELSELAGNAALRKALQSAVERVNGKLATLEKVRRFAVASAPFTTENGQMTPTLKIRRHRIVQAYGESLESFYR